MFKELKTLKGYLEVLGITQKDLEISAATGFLNLNSINTENFCMRYSKRSKKKRQVKRTSQNFSNSMLSAKEVLEPLKQSKSNIPSSSPKHSKLNLRDSNSSSSESLRAKVMISVQPSSPPKAKQVGINDFLNGPASEKDILRHLEKSKDKLLETQKSKLKSTSSTSSVTESVPDSDQSFMMLSRKRAYDEKIKSTRFVEGLIQ